MTNIEDLSNKSKVEEALKSITDSHKAFISADAPEGTDDKASGESGGDDKNKAPSIAEIQ